ncbi:MULTISPECIES: hydroxyacylglutathione hydrolase [unclassified Sphingomonas]|uniref:hydroxyacylglutathione hydrolase n=1 Tax=unclassified Sphingomonas TaxID=196159 RepID=UPI002151698F|nr:MULTISPECIES: hydroxyacylglutathione hydrolase [unclassified Sphingomonas]MCR5870870.1 hydroxyacylglutathione hydrolase [Sphingomonas sp. J344]UUY00809.1 hydroxyacylglutathione hydrolase [Sphingomonas sp. J315]
MIEVVRIPALSDNYIWMAHDPASGETIVVDPAAADPVLEGAAARGWTITAIWNTHWHPDHTGGNAAIKAATGCTVIAPAAESAKIPTADRLVAEGDMVMLGTFQAEVIDVPAHTAGHIAYHLPEAEIVFVGDTLFAMGCGRLFEGTAAQMFANMQRLAALPGDTTVYCAHEYTQSNGRYALVAEPDNAALIARMAEVDAMRAQGLPTVPTSIALERATNPFMRASSVEELAERRAAKDSFRG